MKQDRDINKLVEPFRTKVFKFLNECKKQDIDIFVTEAHRSEARQRELYNQGRTTPGAIVTWTMNSVHRTGGAIDIAFSPSKYGTLYPNDMNLWNKVFDIAEKFGISCGYRLWGCDKAHLQNNSKFDNNNLNKYVMDNKLRVIMVNKAIDATGCVLSLLWNYLPSDDLKLRVADIKKEILLMKE